MSVNVYNLIVVGCILQNLLTCEWNKPYAEAISLKPVRHGSHSQLHNYNLKRLTCCWFKEDRSIDDRPIPSHGDE